MTWMMTCRSKGFHWCKCCPSWVTLHQSLRDLRHTPTALHDESKAMNINDLTIYQAKELISMFGQESAKKPHPFVGEYVILRCYSAGVHAGVLLSQDGDLAVLGDARRLWSWKARGGVALSGLSQYGLDSGKIDTKVPRIAITGVIETIPCSIVARESIDGSK